MSAAYEVMCQWRVVSGRYSVHYSSHDEHPPPISRLFQPIPAVLGWDSPGVAGDIRGSQGRRSP